MTYYPESARHLHEEGFVTLKFLIEEDGTVADPSIVRSSGFADLDDAAIEAVKTWHYKPATKDGKPIVVRSEANVRFHLEENTENNGVLPGVPYTQLYMSAVGYPPSALAAKEEGQVGLGVGVAENGSVISADVVRPSGSQALDDASVALAKGHWHFTPATLNGQPVKSVVPLILNWALPASPGGDIASPRSSDPATAKNPPPVFTAPQTVGAPHTAIQFYPPLARRRHEQGYVHVAYMVREDGRFPICR